MEEIWKDIPNYEGLYQVSNFGNVKSLARIVLRQGKYPFLCEEKIRINTLDRGGYYICSLHKNSKRKMYKVHQLVAMAFLNHKPCGFKLVIDHINNIKSDNRLENLQIVTQRFNAWKFKENKTSKYKGVYWHKAQKKWCVRIVINKKRKHLGYFDCELKAHLVYQNAIKQIK